MRDSETHDYIGITGLVLAFLGLFLPFIGRLSLFDLLNDDSHLGVLIPILFLIFGALFATDYRALTRMTDSSLLIALFVCTFTGEYKIPIRVMHQILGAGFWVVTIGLLLAIFSPLLQGVNEKINRLICAMRK